MKKKELLNVALYLFAFLTIQAITVAVVMLVSQTAGITAGITTITTLVSSLITIALFYKLRWTPCSGDYINTRPWFTMFWVVCLTIGTIAPLAYLNELLGIELPDTYNEMFKGIMSHKLGFITIGIIAPIAEEYVFRGAILRVLCDMAGKHRQWVAIALSAALFAIVHGNMAQGIGAFLCGLLLGWMYVRTGSIMPGVVFHWVNNSTAVLLYRIMPQCRHEVRRLLRRRYEARGARHALLADDIRSILVPAQPPTAEAATIAPHISPPHHLNTTPSQHHTISTPHIMPDFRDITVSQSVRFCDGSHIGNDILLLDEVSKIPIPREPRRMQCLLLAMCLEGNVSYYVDSVKHNVEPGDLIIINQGRSVYNCTLSPDCRGIGILVDYKFFNETIKSVHELSSLFLFARNHPVFRLPKERFDFIYETFFRIKAKIDEPENRFRREMVQAMFLTMAYELSNVIYSVQAQNEAATRAPKRYSRSSSNSLRRTFVRSAAWAGTPSSSAYRPSISPKPSRRCRSARRTSGSTLTSPSNCVCCYATRRKASRRLRKS